MILLKNERGFTLIELLIVIVVIGILAGVLIAVIDPATQQNRARNAAVSANMNKIALNISGFVSSTGRIPMEQEVLQGMNATAFNNCGTANTAACSFRITNFNLPAGGTNGCTGGALYDGVGAGQCLFYYCGGDGANDATACTWSVATTQYRLFAKLFGSRNVYMYRSSTSTMNLCDFNSLNCNPI